MTDYEIDGRDCPKCGSSDTRSQVCTDIDCDDGVIDEHDYDPVNYGPGSYLVCGECHGTGVIIWCAKCGHELNAKGSDG